MDANEVCNNITPFRTLLFPPRYSQKYASHPHDEPVLYLLAWWWLECIFERSIVSSCPSYIIGFQICTQCSQEGRSCRSLQSWILVEMDASLAWNVVWNQFVQDAGCFFVITVRFHSISEFDRTLENKCNTLQSRALFTAVSISCYLFMRYLTLPCSSFVCATQVIQSSCILDHLSSVGMKTTKTAGSIIKLAIYFGLSPSRLSLQESIYTFFALVLCFVALSTTLLPTGRPFRLLILSMRTLAKFGAPTPWPSSPNSSLSSSVRGVKKGSTCTPVIEYNYNYVIKFPQKTTPSSARRQDSVWQRQGW